MLVAVGDNNFIREQLKVAFVNRELPGQVLAGDPQVHQSAGAGAAYWYWS